MDYHGYALLEEWHNRGSGLIVRAAKDGRTWFLKRYRTVVMPLDNGTLNPRTIAENRAKFERFAARRRRVNRALRAVAPEGGNLVVPREEFIEGNEYCEASEFVTDAVPEGRQEALLRSMSPEARLLVMKTAAAALEAVHRQHVVHSDLKPENVMLVRKAGDRYVAKLIDFDGGYLTDDKPAGVGGTIDYFSPEQGTYSMFEGDETQRAALAARLSEKSDIFSLGLLFHYYLAGELPTPVNLTPKLQQRRDRGKVIYCWIALNAGCALALSPAVTDAGVRALIADMLNPDPALRPDAAGVLTRLNAASRPAPVTGFCEPWPEHGVVFDGERLRRKKVKGIARETVDGEKVYYLFYEDDSKDRFATLRSMLLAKFAVPGRKDAPRGGAPSPAPPLPSPSPAGAFAARPEDGIFFEEEALKRRGFTGASPAEMGGVRGYALVTAEGETRFLPPATLLMMRLAGKI